MSSYMHMSVEDSNTNPREDLVACYVYHDIGSWHLKKPCGTMMDGVEYDAAMLMCLDDKMLPMFFSFKACDYENTSPDKVDYRAVLGENGQPVYTQMSVYDEFESDEKNVLSFLEYAAKRSWSSIMWEILSMYV